MRMVSVPPLSVSLGLMVSSEVSRLTLILDIVLCVHAGTWVVGQSGGEVELCGRALVASV